MPIITFDTCIFISYKPAELPAGFRMSAVVLQELTTGSADKSEVQHWHTTWKLHEKEKTLLVPSGEDWWLAGKVLNSLLRGLKSKSGGKTPKLPADEKQRIIRDVLLARTAKQAGALLITNNLSDFQMIRQFCNVRIKSGEDYFGYGY